MADRRMLLPVLAIVAFFVIVVVSSLALSSSFVSMGYQAFGEEGAANPLWSVVYIVSILVFTAFILLLVKKGRRKFIQAMITLVIFVSLVYVIAPLLTLATTPQDDSWDVGEGPDGFAPERATVFELDGRTFVAAGADGPDGERAAVAAWRDGRPVVWEDADPDDLRGNWSRPAWDGKNLTVCLEEGDSLVALDHKGRELWSHGFRTDVAAWGTGDVFDEDDGDYAGEELLVVLPREMMLFYSTDDLWDSHVTFQVDTDTREDGRPLALVPMEGDDFTVIIFDGDRTLDQGVYFQSGDSFTIPCGLAIVIAAALVVLMVKWPEWYVVNSVGILVGVGICTIIGVSLSILPLLVLLTALAAYDAWAVYRTKHMLDLADTVVGMRLPLLLVMPRTRGYSFRSQPSVKRQLARKERRDALFIGLGDIIIPGCLAVSAYTFLNPYVAVAGLSGNLVVALGTLAGILVGYFVLMTFVLRGNPQAGLPLLNGGAILGFMMSYIVVYQNATFGITMPF